MFFLKLLPLLAFLALNHAAYGAKNLTSKIEFIGSPYKAQYKSGEDIYARNVWDLQSFNNHLYIGAGNSSNKGPSTNAGPIQLHKFDPKQNTFSQEGLIKDEQINRFHLLNQQLFIPGDDATGSNNWGNFYHKDNQKKLKLYRNIPKAKHVYDLVFMQDTLYAAVILKNKKTAVLSSQNMGKTWQKQTLAKHKSINFMTINDTLLAVNEFKKSSLPTYSVSQWLKVSKTFLPRYDIDIDTIFPETKFKHSLSRISRTINVKNKVLYIGAYSHNDHQTKPFGLYLATLKDNHFIAEKITLDKKEIPRDIIRKGDNIYLLTSQKESTQTLIKVHQFHPDNSLTTLFSFNYPSFARSFEQINGDFYFGIGSDIKSPSRWKLKELLAETGDILRLKKEFIDASLAQ